MYYIYTTLLILVLSVQLVADAEINFQYLKVTTKQASQKKSSQKECNFYVEIQGNKDWKKKKQQLITFIKNSNKCRQITIYKTINNVHTRDGNTHNQFAINLGAIIEKTRNVKINTVIIIKNSSITDGYFNNNRSNIGNVIQSYGRGNTYINNVEIDTNIQIDDSKIGTSLYHDAGINHFQNNLEKRLY